MMLGDLLSSARKSSALVERWLEERGDNLVEECRAAAATEGQSLNRWLTGSVAWFERHASGDDWADVTSRMKVSETPGQDCLLAIIAQRLAHGSCQHGHDHDHSPLEKHA